MRPSKAAMVAAIALLTTLIAFGNLTDYGTNWAFVPHGLSMDTTFPISTTPYRAVTDSTLKTAGCWLLIAAGGCPTREGDTTSFS